MMFLNEIKHIGEWMWILFLLYLASWKKSYDQRRQHMKKQRHFFTNKGLSSRSYGFSSSRVWMWSWSVKKAECWRTDAFELWYWKLLRVPWTPRRSNQSILKEISPDIHWKDWGWSRNANTLAAWCEELSHLKRPWCWERWKSGEGDNRGWDGWMASPMRWIWIYVDSRSWWWTGRPGMLQSLWSQRVGHDWVTELNWYLCLDDAHMGNDFVGKWLLMTWVFIADGTSWFLEMWPKGRASREGEWLRMESWRLPLAPHTSGLMGMVLIG